eukprot:m.26659 g.26659  ORF g.26659 m.26659 type:complete len:395 (+) comp9964_c1_seq1:62-1246(+)
MFDTPAFETYLSLFVALDPPLRTTVMSLPSSTGHEDPALLAFAANWTERLKKKQHTVRATVEDINGNTLFITRFVCKQTPPPSLLDPTRSDVFHQQKRLARFVSLIPFVSDSTTFIGTSNLWCTSEQFLQMVAGDYEEHALLLCNFFLGLGVDAYVVDGQGIPEGATMYVLSKLEKRFTLWNPITGEHYALKDYFCPLKKVDFVFNDCNIWANIQEQANPSRISFDFSAKRDWQPLFGPHLPYPGLVTVQEPVIQLAETDIASVEATQTALEEALRSSIEQLRDGRFPTRWNRHASALLKKMLPDLEDARMEGIQSMDASLDLSELTPAYEIIGFPLNLPFVSVAKAVEAVHTTGLHEHEDPRAEFALAVQFCPYPNNVLSLWIFLAVLIPRTV